MAYNDRKYIIIPIADVTEAMVNECLETSIESLRLNNAQIDTILKWLDRNGVPSTIAALEPTPTIYSHSQIIAIIDNPSNGWIEVEE